jgi:Sulphur transport
MTALIIACVFAFILGFAAHRASVCAVRGVAELMHARTAYMVWSMTKSALWVMALAVPFFLFVSTMQYVGAWELTGFAVAGGFLFGVGAAINGACAYSTMTKMVDGDGGMLVAVLGFAVGIVIFVGLINAELVPRPSSTYANFDLLKPLAWLIIAALTAGAIYEAVRLWRTREAGLPLLQRLVSPKYRLSTAALLIGFSSGIIVLNYGSPGYSSTYQQVIEGVIGSRPFPPAGRVLFLLCVLLGMLVSTLQRRSFRLDLRPRRIWLRHLFGGTLMGLGTALAPGGNASLVLYGIPSLSPHALPAFTAMMVGIALGLVLMRLAFGIEMRVMCRNDLYITDAAPK